MLSLGIKYSVRAQICDVNDCARGAKLHLNVNYVSDPSFSSPS